MGQALHAPTVRHANAGEGGCRKQHKAEVARAAVKQAVAMAEVASEAVARVAVKEAAEDGGGGMSHLLQLGF